MPQFQYLNTNKKQLVIKMKGSVLFIIFLSLICIAQPRQQVCVITNCAVHFICYNCSQGQICETNSQISGLLIRPFSCPVYESGSGDSESLCQDNCNYCFAKENAGKISQVCTICKRGYSLQEGECFNTTKDVIQVMFSSFEGELTTGYVDHFDQSSVGIEDKHAPGFDLSTSTTAVVSILAVGIISWVVFLQSEPFIRFLILAQHLYHFSFKNPAIPRSQGFLVLLNTLNLGFINQAIYFLPRKYQEATSSNTYFILNIDANLFRNAGGSIFTAFVVLLVLINLWICKLSGKINLLIKHSSCLLILWSILQNNLIYFSLNSLINQNTSNTNFKISLSLKIISGVSLLLFLFGVIIIYKLFNNRLNPCKIQKYELLALIAYHFIVNLLLVFGQSGISQYFVVLIHLLYIGGAYYLKGKQSISRRRFVVAEGFGLNVYVCLLADVDQAVVIGGLVSYFLVNLWDHLLTKHEFQVIEDLNSFKEDPNSNSNPNLILITEADIVSHPTMKKLFSNASTDA